LKDTVDYVGQKDIYYTDPTSPNNYSQHGKSGADFYSVIWGKQSPDPVTFYPQSQIFFGADYFSLYRAQANGGYASGMGAGKFNAGSGSYKYGVHLSVAERSWNDTLEDYSFGRDSIYFLTDKNTYAGQYPYEHSTSSTSGFKVSLMNSVTGAMVVTDPSNLGFSGYYAGEYINFESFDMDGNTSTTVQTPAELSLEVHEVDSASTGVFITPSEILIAADSFRLKTKGGSGVYAPTTTTTINYTVVLSDNNSGAVVVASPALIKRQTSGTPSGTADSQGTQGDMLYDSSYIYIKTAAGWKRVSLSTF
jgi:hypothetical protein